MINLIDENKAKIVINKIPVLKDYPDYLMNADDVIDTLQMELLGIISLESCVEKSMLTGNLAIFENDVLNNVFDNITNRILGKTVPIYKFEYEKQNKSLNFLNKLKFVKGEV